MIDDMLRISRYSMLDGTTYVCKPPRGKQTVRLDWSVRSTNRGTMFRMFCTVKPIGEDGHQVPIDQIPAMDDPFRPEVRLLLRMHKQYITADRNEVIPLGAADLSALKKVNAKEPLTEAEVQGTGTGTHPL
jgi:hypothetical protein